MQLLPMHRYRSGALIGNGTSRTGLTIGYIIGGGLMIAGGLVEVFFGINAEGKALESVARPLTQVTEEEPGSGPGQAAGAPAPPAGDHHKVPQQRSELPDRETTPPPAT
jgi:hypothetical protein